MLQTAIGPYPVTLKHCLKLIPVRVSCNQ